MSSHVKQLDELMRMGGIFYAMNGESWCDTPADSWKLVPGTGYVRHIVSCDKSLAIPASDLELKEPPS